MPSWRVTREPCRPAVLYNQTRKQSNQTRKQSDIYSGSCRIVTGPKRTELRRLQRRAGVYCRGLNVRSTTSAHQQTHDKRQDHEKTIYLE